LATQADIDAGFDLYSEIELSNELGLSPYVYDIFSDVFAPLLNNTKVTEIGVTREDILKKHYEVRHKALSPETLKREIIPQLELVGILLQKPDPDDKRRLLIYPTMSTPIIPSSTDDQEKEKGVREQEQEDKRNRSKDSGVSYSSNSFFWEIYCALENQNHGQSSVYGIVTVSESMLKQNLISSDKFTAGEAAQIIKDKIDGGELTRLAFDVLSRKSHPNLPPKDEEEGRGN
jgi:hypothetical protein